MKKLGPENVFMSVADAVNNVPFSIHSNEIEAHMTQLTLVASGQVSGNPYHRILSPFTSTFRDSTIDGDTPMIIIVAAGIQDGQQGGSGGIGGGSDDDDDANYDDKQPEMGMQLMEKRLDESDTNSNNNKV